MPDTPLPTLYSITDAAEKLGRDRRTLYRWIKSGKLSAIRLMGQWAVTHKELERLLGIEITEPSVC